MKRKAGSGLFVRLWRADKQTRKIVMAGSTSLVLAHIAAEKGRNFLDMELARPTPGKPEQARGARIQRQCRRRAPIHCEVAVSEIFDLRLPRHHAAIGIGLDKVRRTGVC